MGQDDQQQDGAAIPQDTPKNATPQPGVGAGAPAPATSSNPTQQSQPESTGAGTGNGTVDPSLEPIPAAVVPPEEQLNQANNTADAFTDFDPTNPREFDPTVVLLHLERDGVIVEGFIDPFTGAGCRDLLVRLQDELVKARAREDGAAPAHVQVGEAPDPNALKRQRATAAGHDIDPETKRCRNCLNAEWWCLEGNPCEPRADTIPSLAEEMADGEAHSQIP